MPILSRLASLIYTNGTLLLKSPRSEPFHVSGGRGRVILIPRSGRPLLPPPRRRNAATSPRAGGELAVLTCRPKLYFQRSCAVLAERAPRCNCRNIVSQIAQIVNV